MKIRALLRKTRLKNPILPRAMFFAALLGWCAFPAHAYLGSLLHLPPQDRYQTLRHEGFKLIFPEKFEKEARQVLAYLAEARLKLEPLFHYDRTDHVSVLLTDVRDAANGATSAIGLQGLVLYLKTPEPYFSIGEYDDWLRMLVFHEYAHFLVLNQTRGFFAATRLLFGHLLLPNEGWPAWLNEGLAVWVESRFTRQGRGHGAYYNTITRDAIAHGALATDDFLGFNLITANPRPEFPFGESAYYAGYGIIEELTRELGVDALGKLVEEGSGRVPYFLNGTLGNLAPKSWAELWQAWADREKKRLSAELAWHEENRAHEPRIEYFSKPGDHALGARLSPDGKQLAYAEQSGHEEYSLYLASTADKSRRLVIRGLSNPGVSFSADSSTLYFSRDEYVGEHRIYSDLYAYDIPKDAHRRLSRGLRARDPSLCGKNALAYATQEGRFSRIGLFSLEDRQSRTLYRAPEFSHVSNVRCDSGGERVYFSERAKTGLDVIRAVDARSGAPLPLSVGDGLSFGAIFPEPLPNGDLYFTRVQNGYYDLALFSPKKGVSALAHSTFGYWMPSLEAGKMAATLLTYQGGRAALIQLDPAAKAGDDAPVASATLKKELAPPLPPSITDAPKTENYFFYESLAPRLWSPYVRYGALIKDFGAEIAGWDDTDQFEYTLLPWYDAFTGKLMGRAATGHRLSAFELALGFSRKTIDAFQFSDRRKLYSFDTTFSAALSRPWRWTRFALSPSIVAEWNRSTIGGDLGSQSFAPDKRIGADLAANALKSYSFSIAPESGWNAALQGRWFFSGDQHPSKALARFQQIASLPPSHGALDLRLFGALAPSATFDVPDSIAQVGGAGDPSILNLPLRGYPGDAFHAKRAVSFQTEYRLPISQVFRSSDTFPLFTRNLGLALFYDGAKAQEFDMRWKGYCAGAGAALLLNMTAFYHLPLSVRFQFAKGFQKNHRAENTFNVSVGGL